jgi:serine protease AprX
VNGFAAQVPPGAIARLRTAGAVVDGDAGVKLAGFYGAGSGEASAVFPDATRASAAWAAGFDGTGTTVAVLDTGIDTSGDLAGKVVAAVDLSGEGAPSRDSYGHGTFVAGLIAGSGTASNGGVKGEAPGAKLASIKVAGANGQTDLLQVLAGIQWAILFKDTYNIRVLNLSIGLDSVQDWRIDPLNAAVERAWLAGIVVTVSAGNAGGRGPAITKPGDDPFVITVGAADDHTSPRLSTQTLAPFSSVGPTAAGVAKPDLLAPGTHVVSVRDPGSTVDTAYPSARVGDSYFRGSGTSFSSAVAAGAAALVLSRTPSLTPDQVKARLVDSGASTNHEGEGTSVDTGLLNAAAAVMSNSTDAANEHLVASDGSGSLQASAGSFCIRDPRDGTCQTDAEVAQEAGSPWYLSTTWESTTWESTTWESTTWQSTWSQLATWLASPSHTTTAGTSGQSTTWQATVDNGESWR